MTLLQSLLGSLSPGRDQALAALRAAGLFLVLGTVPAPAIADMFTVSALPIEATGESADAAKSIAIAEGQAKAYAELMRRITRPDDASRLPPADSTTLQGVIGGYSLDNERTGPTQYLADLTVRFNAEAVELLLSQYDIRLAVEQSPPALVVPVFWTGDRGIVWERENDWRSVWERIDLDNRLVPVLLPLADATDASIDASSLSRADPTALDLLRGRYGVEYVFASLFAYDSQSGRMEASLTGQGPRGSVDLREQATAEAGEQAEAMEAMAGVLLDRLDDEWRAAQSLRAEGSDTQTVTLNVEFASIQEWVGIRSRLEAILGPDKVEVRALNAGSAQVEMSFSTEFRALLAELEYQGLYLYDDGTNWILRAN